MARDLTGAPLAKTLKALVEDGGDAAPSWIADVPPEGYTSLASLPESDKLIAWLLACLPDVWDSDDPRFGAAWLFEKTVEHTVSAFVGCFVLDHRVPLAGPESVWVIYNHEGACSEPVFSDPRFACLADDPDAHHEHALVKDSLDDLRDYLLQRLHDVYLPLARALARQARRGLRTQLKVIADLAIVAGWWFAREYRDEAGEFRYAEMLGLGGPPLWGKAGFREFPHRGRVFRHRIRNTCCLFYTRKENRYCFTCPLRSRQNRLEQWAAHFDARIAIAEEGK